MWKATPSEIDLLLTGNFITYLRMDISISGGGYGGVEDIIGFDALLGATWKATVDDATATGEIRLAAWDTMRGKSLSPLHSDFKDLFRPGRLYNLYTATLPHGFAYPTSPASPAWKQVLHGRVDNVNIDGEDMVLEVRGQESWVLDDWITQDTKYGGGQPADQVINQIMSDWVGLTNPFTGQPIDLVTVLGSLPAFAVNDYTQGKMPLWLAVRAIALQFGWDLRWIQFSNTEGGFYLYDPEEGPGGGPIVTIPSSMYEELGNLVINGDDVRNVIFGRYGNGLEAPIVYDQDSVNAYGSRPMWLFEDMTSNIDTEPEMTAMMQAALRQLKEPMVSFGASMPYFWPVHLNDKVIFQGDGFRFNTDTQLVISGYEHVIQNGEGKSTLFTRPAGAAAFRDWLRSVPKKVYGSMETPDDAVNFAEEGAIWIVVEDEDFPA